MDFNEEMKKWQTQKQQEFGQMLFAGWLMSGLIGAFLWTYVINAWMEYAGKVPSVPWWQGLLIGLVPLIGPLSIPAAVATWIILMIIR